MQHQLVCKIDIFFPKIHIDIPYTCQYNNNMKCKRFYKSRIDNREGGKGWLNQQKIRYRSCDCMSV